MIRVMTKGGKSYVKLGYGGKYRINGQESVPARGDTAWSVVDGDVDRIEQYVPGPRTLSGFSRVQGSPDTIPAWISVAAVERDADGEWRSRSGYDLGYYYPEYTQADGSWIAVDFDVIDRDCEPVRLPDWCVVDWPANIEHYPEQQHKYPCHVSVKRLFELVAHEVEKLVESSPVLSWDKYLNIGTFTVKHRVDIPPHLRTKETREVYRRPNSKKTTKETIVREHRWEQVLKLNGFYQNRSPDDVYVPELRGSNYADLKKKVDDYIQSIVSLCDPARWTVCEACSGHGMVRLSPRDGDGSA